MKRSQLFFGLLRLPIDFVLTVLALLAAYWLRARIDVLPAFLKQPDLGSFPLLSEYIRFAFIAALAFIVIITLFGNYSLKRRLSFGEEIKAVFFAALILLMAVITYYFFIREFPFSRLVLFYGSGFIFLSVLLGRLFIRLLQAFLVRFGIGKRRIVFLGKNSLTEALVGMFQKEGTIHFCGVASDVLELLHVFDKDRTVEEVIQTDATSSASDEVIDMCRARQIAYHFVPSVLEMHRTNVDISTIGGIPLISLRPTSLGGWGAIIKRIFDVGISLFALLVLAPFFLIIAIAIKLDCPGTVFFRFLDDGTRAKRIGHRGKPFPCLKFRTMRMGTHNLRYTELADNNLRAGTPLVKIKNDPRVTRVGKFLRRFSIDELPQLFNVLVGDMSLVGPRPHLPEEVKRYKQHHKFVFTIRPGITGLAQIAGRSDLPFEEEVRLDTYYIEHWSLLLDIKILLKTVRVVLRPYRE